LRCRICGKPLTDPESKKHGIGPECRAKYPYFEREAKQQQELPFGNPENKRVFVSYHTKPEAEKR